jgi:hypothetical protein
MVKDGYQNQDHFLHCLTDSSQVSTRYCLALVNFIYLALHYWSILHYNYSAILKFFWGSLFLKKMFYYWSLMDSLV